MILGYIVTEKRIKGIKGFVEQVDNIVKADSTKPILVVGWKNAKKYEGYKGILDKTLGKGVFWTFSKAESRSDFEDDLDRFYSYIYNNILNNIRYYYINIFKLNYNKIKKLINIIDSKERKNIYINNNDFIYIPYNGNILGISLTMLEYCGIGKEKVIKRLKKNPSNIFLDNSKRKVLSVSLSLGNKRYALPYFIE